jgi:hypothetical protein
MLRMLSTGDACRWEADRFVIGAPPAPTIAVFGPYYRFEPARYRVTWRVSMDRCADTERPRGRFDVTVDAHDTIAATDVREPTEEVSLEFTVPSPDRLHELRAFTGSCPYSLHAVDVERVHE